MSMQELLLHNCPKPTHCPPSISRGGRRARGPQMFSGMLVSEGASVILPRSVQRRRAHLLTCKASPCCPPLVRRVPVSPQRRSPHRSDTDPMKREGIWGLAASHQRNKAARALVPGQQEPLTHKSQCMLPAQQTDYLSPIVHKGLLFGSTSHIYCLTGEPDLGRLLSLLFSVGRNSNPQQFQYLVNFFKIEP